MSYSKLKKMLRKRGFKILEKKRTMIVFGAKYLEPFYGLIAFFDQIFPKKFMYLGAGFVVVAKLKV
jgi:hypothetical protein